MKLNSDNILLDELLEKLKDKNLVRKITRTNFDKTEFCPIFEYNSIQPKTKFNHFEVFGEKSYCSIERSLFPFFGLPQYGVHCNGWKKKSDEFYFFFAKRSKHLNDFPNLYDNLVGGGQPSGISIYENLKKEAFEEAGIFQLKKKYITKGNTINYFHNHKNFAFSGIIFVYDYEIYKDINFKNMDGEVESFYCISVDKLFTLLEKKKLKPNAIISIADFFLRNLSEYFPKTGILEIKNILKND